MILAGDVGGTSTRLARFDVEGDRLRLVRTEVYESGEVDGLEAAIRKFEPSPKPPFEAAAFGVAGPVARGRVHTTNLPWEIDAVRLSQDLGIPMVRLLNDLEAMAWGIEVLEPEDLVTLQQGDPVPDGNGAVIAAGTGLGEALLIRREEMLHPVATEGGHADFAPPDDEAVAFLRWIREKLEHVSAERVASGIGLNLLYKYHHGAHSGSAEPHLPGGEEEIPARMAEEAARGGCASCVLAFDVFLRCYGAEAGNLALKAGATSGLYVGGGIAAKNIDMMRDGRFIDAFAAKGRFEPYMRKIPVRVIMNQSAPLLGAALVAARAAGAMA